MMLWRARASFSVGTSELRKHYSMKLVSYVL